MGAVMHETDEIRVLDHGFVRLDGCMADDLSVVNGARVSFAQRSDEMTDREAGLIRFLMRERHGSPFEHNAFRFHIKLPIFVMREWARHRIGCLTGDTEVTFVDVNGQTSRAFGRRLTSSGTVVEGEELDQRRCDACGCACSTRPRAHSGSAGSPISSTRVLNLSTRSLSRTGSDSR